MKTSWTVCAGALAATLAIGVTGCTDEKRPAMGAAETHKTFVMFPTPALVAYQSGTRPMVARVVVDPRIAKECNITEPKFDFDSAAVPRDAELDRLATCFKEGPMNGKMIYLVGRTDARGDADYNMKLGRERADNVATYLADRGLIGVKVQTASRGEQGATGVDEQGMAEDRRVDILLVDD